jgi:hypothetical protein
MSRIRAFSFQHRKFQVRASGEANGWVVRLFEDGRRASPLVYKVSYEENVGDQMHDHPGDFAGPLMVLMQSDVESGRLRLAPKSN